VSLEHALHSFAVRILRTVNEEFKPRFLLRDHHTFVGLNALAITLHDLELARPPCRRD